MDVRVTDGNIDPVQSRIRAAKPAPDLIGPWSVDDVGAFLSYSAADTAAITKALDGLGIGAAVIAEPQPNPTHLALLQGTVSSRSEALAALEALGKGETPAIPELRLKQLEAQVADLEAAKEIQL